MSLVGIKVMRSIYTALGLLFLCSMFVTPVAAQCTPAAYEPTFNRVYRDHRFFIEGMADLTGDGKPDAYGYRLQANATYQDLVVLPNNGTGGFGDPIVSPTTVQISNDVGKNYGVFYGGVAIGDLNNDGKPDAIVRANTSPRSLVAMINNGTGSFTQTTLSLSDGEYIHTIVDINADGRGDLIAMGFSNFYGITVEGSSIAYRLQNADGTFAPRVFLDMQNMISPAIGDFDADGKVDIAFSYYSSASPAAYYVKFLKNIGSGIFSPTTPVVQNVEVVRAADMNNDGKLDLVATYAVLFNDGVGNFTKASLPTAPAPSFPTSFLYNDAESHVIDHEGDGDKDIIVLYGGRATPGDLRKSYFSVYQNNGTGTFTRVNYNKRLNGIPVDFNGDGKWDTAHFANSVASNQRQSGSNDSVAMIYSPTCTPSAPTGQTKIIDFTGDGSSDVISWNPSNGLWNYASNVTSGSIQWGLGSQGDVPTPGDFDGDGKTDPTVFRASNGTWWIFRSSDSTWNVYQFGLNGDKPLAADFNGDGRSDIAIYRPSLGQWYVMISGSGQVIINTFGVSGDKPVVQDYDGDGKADIAIFRPSTGVWWILRSSDGGAYAVPWGISTDEVIPADYDLDGKADIAVFRQGIWYVQRSFDGVADIFQLGTTNDIPFVADSNGDGIVEVGVYRNANSWYLSSQPNLLWANFITQKQVRLGLPND